MYWREVFATPAHAARALKYHQSGQRSLLPAQVHAAQAAVRSLGALTEFAHLGNEFSTGLTEGQKLGGLKKDIKKALKSNDVAKIQKVMAKEQAKIDKAPNSKKTAKRLDYVTQLQARAVSVGTPAGVAPATSVLPGAPEQPIPQLPALTSTDPASFSQGGGGSSGPSFSAPQAPADADASDMPFGLSLPAMLGIGAAALFGLYLLTRKH